MQNNRITTATDPADVAAHACAKLGMSRQLQIARRDLPHPRRGGCSGYPVWFRIIEVARWQAGLPLYVASLSSVRRWARRLRPRRRNGNRARTKLVGLDVLNLAIFLLAHPDAIGEEVATFLYNEGADELFSLSTLYTRMCELGYSKKFASIEAYHHKHPGRMFCGRSIASLILASQLGSMANQDANSSMLMSLR
jgi:hypothetical protein